MADEDQNDDVMGDVTDEDADQLLNGDQKDDKGTDAGQPATGKPVADPDVERWKKLSRQNEKALRDAQTKLKAFEDKNKTESQRLQEALTGHQSRADKAESALKRRELAEELAPEHATLAQIKAVARRMSGDSDDDLEADAKELFELIAPAPSKLPVPGRPKEKLRGGSDPDGDDDGELDPAKLAARIPRRR